MTVRFIKPGPLARGKQLVLSAASHSTGAIIFKVKVWDPTKHPRGYKGLFIETPDKLSAGSVGVGDVIATKSGKVFKVDGHGPKGIKVTSVDPDSGEVLSKGTVVANGIEVARVEGGKPVGSVQATQDVDPGTVVMNPKNGKRFKVAKHGKWTTVHPVDAQGNITGKHTVLPPGQAVTIASVGPSAPQPSSSTPAPRAPAVPPTSAPSAPAGPVVEQLPSKLPAAARFYPAGVGRDTQIVIRETRSVSMYGSTETQYHLYRTDDPTLPVDQMQRVGTESSLAKAKKEARIQSGDHEGIVARLEPDHRRYRPQPGDMVLWGSNLRMVQRVDVGVSSDTVRFVPRRSSGSYGDSAYLKRYDQHALIPVSEAEMAAAAPTRASWLTKEHLRSGDEIKMSQEELARFFDARPPRIESLRGARPKRYKEALQRDWDLSKLTGQTSTAALKQLEALGYGEITPREPDKLKVVNNTRKRLDLQIQSGKVVSVDERQTESTTGASVAFHDQLRTVIESGGDVRELDPSKSPFEEERGSLVRQLVYDTALGKQNQVAAKLGKSTAKVKPDADYLKEIEADGQIKRSQYASQVESPDVGLPARGTVIDEFWYGTRDDFFDFPSRRFRINMEMAEKDMTEAELAALTGAVSRRGVAVLSTTIPSLTPENDADGHPDPFDFAIKLSEAHALLAAGKPSSLDQLPESGRLYVQAILGSVPVPTGEAKSALEVSRREMTAAKHERDRRIEAVFANAMKDEVAKRRRREGTVASAQPKSLSSFDLPIWEELAFAKQETADLQSLVDNIPDEVKAMVPAFFSGGLLTDGVAYFGKGRVTSARVPQEMDELMKKRLVQADEVENSKDINPGYASSSGTIHPGKMLLIKEQEESTPVESRVRLDEWMQDIAPRERTDTQDPFRPRGQSVLVNGKVSILTDQSVRAWSTGMDEVRKAVDRGDNLDQLLGAFTAGIQQAGGGPPLRSPDVDAWMTLQNQSRAAILATTKRSDPPRTLYRRAAAEARVVADSPAAAASGAKLVFEQIAREAETRAAAHRAGADKLSKVEFDRNLGRVLGAWMSTNPNANQVAVGDVVGKLANATNAVWAPPGDKRIEYVPHDVPGQNAPTNQRGRLTIEGYSPEEAIEKLKDLGVVHDLEPEVPFQSVLRSSRRYGAVLPLLSEYVQGEAPLPTIPAAITHGLTGGMWGAAAKDNRLKLVLESGGLLSTSERFRQGIAVATTTPAGDIRSGVDHVLFGCMGMSHYGDIKIVYKDSAYLRRDVLITNRDFGPQNTRYPSYRKYHNEHRKKGGEDDTDTNIYKPLSAGARQTHINDIMGGVHSEPDRLSASNNEWNIGPSVPIEDMATIIVPNKVQADGVNLMLDKMLREGRISERPKVLAASSGAASAKTHIRRTANWMPVPVPKKGS